MAEATLAPRGATGKRMSIVALMAMPAGAEERLSIASVVAMPASRDAARESG
jgi:hypothetical protein